MDIDQKKIQEAWNCGNYEKIDFPNEQIITIPLSTGGEIFIRRKTNEKWGKWKQIEDTSLPTQKIIGISYSSITVITSNNELVIDYVTPTFINGKPVLADSYNGKLRVNTFNPIIGPRESYKSSFKTFDLNFSDIVFIYEKNNHGKIVSYSKEEPSPIEEKEILSLIWFSEQNPK